MAFKDMHLVIDQLSKTLFANDHRRLTAWVDRLIASHREAIGSQTYSFLYSGTIYRQSNVKGRHTGTRILAPHLVNEMEALLKDKAIVEDNCAYVRQTLVALLDPCITVQDVRDTLPECLVPCWPELQQFSRQREPACTIQDNPRALRQYAKILPIMEAYAAARLMF